MSAELQAVLDAALKLSDDDRESLAEQLWESLDDEEESAFEDHPFAAEWDEEIRQRIEDVRSGKESTIPWDQARKLIMEDDDGTSD